MDKEKRVKRKFREAVWGGQNEPVEEKIKEGEIA